MENYFSLFFFVFFLHFFCRRKKKKKNLKKVAILSLKLGLVRDSNPDSSRKLDSIRNRTEQT
jgi:hypothetical protein